MIPFGEETVTLVRRIEGKDTNNRTAVSYETARLIGCSWRRTTRLVRDGSAVFAAEALICRVPAGQTKPRPGDLMILGVADVTITSGADYQSLIEEYRDSDGGFVVTSVKDNARPGMPIPHYAARG